MQSRAILAAALRILCTLFNIQRESLEAEDRLVLAEVRYAVPIGPFPRSLSREMLLGRIWLPL
jgi:hypothetical protein